MSDKKFEKIVTPKFRVSFPNVFEAKSFNDGEPKYSVVMLFPKSTDISKLKAMANQAITNKWPDAAKRPKGLRNPFRDGDTEKDGMDGYAGHIFVTASSKMKPGVVDANVQPILSEEEFYPGCYARATLTCYAYDRAGNRGVAFGLQNVQKLADGEPFSGRSKPEDDFGAIASEEGIAASSDDSMFG